MKVLFKVFITLFVFTISNLLSNDSHKKNIAVLGFSSNSLDKLDTDIITSRFIELLVKSGKYNVIERKEIKTIIDEQAFQNTGITSADAVKFGQVLNANLILLGTLELKNNGIIINSKIIEVETAKIVNNQSMNYKGNLESFYNDGISKHISSLVDEINVASTNTVEKPVQTKVYFNFTQNENIIRRFIIYINKKVVYDNFPNNGTILTKKLKNGTYSLRYKCYSSFGIPNIPAPLDIRSIYINGDTKIKINLNAIFKDDEIQWENSVYKE